MKNTEIWVKIPIKKYENDTKKAVECIYGSKTTIFIIIG